MSLSDMNIGMVLGEEMAKQEAKEKKKKEEKEKAKKEREKTRYKSDIPLKWAIAGLIGDAVIAVMVIYYIVQFFIWAS